MLLALPVSRFRVDYQIASGRPYSAFERMVLQAVHEGAGSINELQGIFSVHPRLILEALVTLVQAGWLALGGASRQDFMLTVSGRQAITSGIEPRSRNVEPKSTMIVLERLTGALISGRDVRLLSTQDLDAISDGIYRLPEKVHESRLNEGQVDAFLPRDKTEWLFRITSIEMKSRQAHWLPIAVDLATGQLDIHLPDDWKFRVGSAILEAARQAPAEVRQRVNHQQLPLLERQEDSLGRSEGRTNFSSWPFASGSVSLLLSDLDHVDYLRMALAKADTSLLIASSFLRTEVLDAMASDFMLALARGVNIDVLWGYGAGEQPDGTSGITVFQRWAYHAQTLDHPGKLRFNREASGTHAKLVVWDRNDEFETCVGSFNWLSSLAMTEDPGIEQDSTPLNASICIRKCGIIPQIMRCAASLWGGRRPVKLDSVADRWRNLAARVEEKHVDASGAQEAIGAPVGTLRMVTDVDHESVLRETLAYAKERILVASHRIGPVAQVRLIAGSNRGRLDDFMFRIVFGRADVDDQTLERLDALVESSGGTMTCNPGMHAKVIVNDDVAYIGSYNFLAADSFGTASRARELSIRIGSGDIADSVFKRFSMAENQ